MSDNPILTAVCRTCGLCLSIKCFDMTVHGQPYAECMRCRKEEIFPVAHEVKEPSPFPSRDLTMAQIASRIMTGRYWAARRDI